MKQEQITSISGTSIYTNGGRRIAIGNAHHKVGNWVWVDSGCIFGHSAPRNNPFVPTPGDVYIEVYNKYDKKYTFRFVTISLSGKKVVKDSVFSIPITPAYWFGYTQYNFADGHFIYNSQGCAFFESIEPRIGRGMNVFLYTNSEWSSTFFDESIVCNLIQAEFIDGDLYWSGIGLQGKMITFYKNLDIIRSVDLSSKADLMYNDFKSRAQNLLNGYLAQRGNAHTYEILDAQVGKTYMPYFEMDDIRTSLVINISGIIYNGSYESYNNFMFYFYEQYIGDDVCVSQTMFSYNNVLYVDPGLLKFDIETIYGAGSKYKIVTTILGTYYKLVDIVNDITYDLTPFKSIIDKYLFNYWSGTVVVITEINTDSLYIYIEEAEYIFSKSKNTLVAINKGTFYIANHQLTKLSKTEANKVIKTLKDKFGT